MNALKSFHPRVLPAAKNFSMDKGMSKKNSKLPTPFIGRVITKSAGRCLATAYINREYQAGQKEINTIRKRNNDLARKMS